MRTHHPDNERIKRRYLDELKQKHGFSEPSLDQVAKAINRFETYTKFRDFRRFHVELVKAFKEDLCRQQSVRTGERLSHATIYSTLNALKAFHEWLWYQPGYKRCFAYEDWEYFNPSNLTVSVAKAHRPSRAPTLEQIRHVLGSMPCGTEIERRDRAIIAFTIVTGARCNALASFRLRHLNLETLMVFQDARAVKTKQRKTFETWFFPVGDDIEQIVIDWGRFLIEEKLWGLDDPLFPATKVSVAGSGQFQPVGFDRQPWGSTGPIRTIFREAFERAGLPYSNPHSFRNTLAALGREKCKTLAEMQAWAQNLGHESLTTTFGSYGKVAPHQQRELVRNVGKRTRDREDRLDELVSMVREFQARQDG
jgi:integrase